MYPKISSPLVENWNSLAFNQNFVSRSPCRTLCKVFTCLSSVSEKMVISRMLMTGSLKTMSFKNSYMACTMMAGALRLPYCLMRL